MTQEEIRKLSHKVVDGIAIALTEQELAEINRLPTESELSDQLSFAKIAKIAKVKLAREIFQYANLTVGGYEFTATKNAKLLFFSKVNGLASTDYPIGWRLADDISWVSLSKTEASALKNAMEAQETSAFKQESVFYIAINKATSVKEVAAIDVKFV